MSKHLLPYRRVNELIAAWEAFRIRESDEDRYAQLESDLYQVRNPEWKGNPPLSVWPAHLIDADDATMAAVEHYFVCRSWVGTGKVPAWELRALGSIYDAGKRIGVTPRHNPNKPVSKLTPDQRAAKEAGILDGEDDLRRLGKKAPLVAMPPKY